ncbi:MAG: hypothetical protein M4579_007217 [Chaenotheca gracillima]|nr:MAG: hypothetical protein M4579_007217 [Chaenotheca gracillima]
MLPTFTSSSADFTSRPASKFQALRLNIGRLFTGTSTTSPRDRSPVEPKAPRTTSFRAFAQGRNDIPNSERRSATSSDMVQLHSPMSSSHSLANPRRTSSTVWDGSLQMPSAPGRAYTGPAQRYAGADHEETYLAQLMHRERRPSRPRKPSSGSRTCFPFYRNRTMRSKVIVCLVSGALLVSVLTIYLSLALSNHIIRQQFHILLILLILFITIVFCHSLIRLCMLAITPSSRRRNRVPSVVGPGGYANVPEPIQVITRHDEEAIGVECEATKVPPPAYGLWRCSVRADPNLLHWQRNDQQLAEPVSPITDHPVDMVPRTVSRTSHRPPSYISDDGVEYAVSAAPRTTHYEEPSTLTRPFDPETIGRAMI